VSAAATARRTILGALAVLFSALQLAGCQRSGRFREITLAAATSLRAVVPELAHAYVTLHPQVSVGATFGASGDLQKQVEGGAPIDAVMLASRRPVRVLGDADLVDVTTARVVATNTIVLVARKGGPKVTFATLDTIPPGERLAIGDPGAVPAGEYARAWLTSIGKWEGLQGRLVLGGDVGAVLAYARRGEAIAAIVYRTEARNVDDIVVLDEARGPDAPRPEVVAAIVHGARGAAEASAFLDFVAAPQGQRILSNFGFGPP
jgi:molybdate transport system substrate-binding protein